MSELQVLPQPSQANTIPKPIGKTGIRYPISRKLAIKARFDSGDSPSEIARSEKITRATIYHIANDPELINLKSEQVKQVKEGLTKLTYLRSFQAIKSISQDKLDRSSALQLMTVGAIGIEKGRLMENLSTDNISHRSVMETISTDVQALAERKRALLDT